MKAYKKMIPCIYLYKEQAVKSWEDHTVLCEDAVALASRYSGEQADELLVFDLSTGDAEHDANLDVLKAICAAVDIPVIGAGNVHRMEDIKKLLYAGCAKAALNYSKAGNIEITKEVSQKFGADKILACVADEKEITENQALLTEFVTEIIWVHGDQLLASLQDGNKVMSETCSLPWLLCVEKALVASDVVNVLKTDGLSGISGNGVNNQCEQISKWKQECKKAGVPVNTLEAKFSWEELKKNSDGMVPVVVQDVKTDEVLMVAYMNEESYQKTVETGKMTYYSRSRQELWLKGDTSGHFQYVHSLTADCDLDTILAKVTQIGAACHTGKHSCFFQPILEKEGTGTENPLRVFEQVMAVIEDRKIHPKEGSYTNYLFEKGIDKILKKLGEEATEIVIAAKNPNANEIKYEIADFLYHMMVLMAEKNVTWEEITTELANR